MSLNPSLLKIIKKIPPAVFIFLLFAAVIYFATYYDYRDESDAVTRQKNNELSAVSELKTKEIENWLWERKSDALIFLSNIIFQQDVLRYLKNTSSDENKKTLSIWLTSLKHNKEYQNIFLTDSSCKFIYSAYGKTEIICTAEKQCLKKAFQSKELLVSDLYKKDDGTIYMDIVVPFFTNDGKDSTPVGALFFLVNPQTSFYPLIQSWPTPSKTSETLLVEKCSDGDSIIYLNELRNKKNTSLNFKISLSDTILPAVKAVLGRTGIFKSKDYRGIEVLAISKKIKGTAWYMITKTDMSEIQEPLKNKTKWFLTLTGLLVLLTTSSLWILWSRRKTKQYKQLYLAIAEKDIAENKFRLFFENSPIGKSITSIDGSIQVNKAFCDMLGYSKDELDNKKFRDITYTEDIAAGDNAIEYLLSGKDVKINFIKRYLHKNGSIVWCEVVTTLQRNYKGQPQFFMTSVNDITKKKKTEDALKDSERKLREAQEMAHLGFWSWDINTGKVEWSDEVYKIFWLDPKEFTPEIDSILSFSPWPEDHVRDQELIDRAIKSHNPGNYEQKFLRPDRSIGYYYSTFQGNYDEKGELIFIVGTVLDITERKLAEEKVSATLKLLDTYIASMYAGILTVSAEGKVKNVNKAFCDIFELREPPETYIGLASPDMIARIRDVYETPDITLNRIREIVALRKPVIGEEIFLRGGRTYLVDFIPIDIEGKNYGHIWHHQDITKLKQAEIALNASERKFRLFFENSAIGESMTEIDGTAHVNKEFCNMLGYSESEMLNINFRDITHPEDIDETENQIADIFAGRSDHADYTKRYLHKNGSIVWCEIHSTIQRDEMNMPLFLTTSIIDITQRKKLEDTVKESEEKYRKLFTEMTSAFALHRIINNERGEAVDYEFIEMNPAFEKLTGMVAENICGKTVKETMPGIEDLWIKNYGKDANEGIPMAFTNYSYELDKHYNVYSYCPRKGYFAVIFNDITEQKNASDKINILNKDLEEKNAELERLIFVASHDLRSPLVNIQGFGGELNNAYNEVKKTIAEIDNITDLRSKLANILDTDIPESINFIELSAQKMNQLISGMLKVSRLGRTEITLAKIDMNELISQISSTFEFVVKKENIVINIGNLPECTADRVLLDQLFANLISNSIKFRSPERQAKINISGYKEGQYSVYCVEDNGIGFSEQYMEKIFMLFHRLNNDIEGEGLGLSIVKKIVDIHKGKIWAESEVGKGSKFYVALSSR